MFLFIRIGERLIRNYTQISIDEISNPEFEIIWEREPNPTYYLIIVVDIYTNHICYAATEFDSGIIPGPHEGRHIFLDYEPPSVVDHVYSYQVFYSPTPYRLDIKTRDGTNISKLIDKRSLGIPTDNINLTVREHIAPVDPFANLPATEKYARLEQLGSGMTGRTYLAISRETQQKVVMKVYNPDKEWNALQEIKLASMLPRHKNIIGMVEFYVIKKLPRTITYGDMDFIDRRIQGFHPRFLSDNTYVLVMEYINNGINLDEYIFGYPRRKRMPVFLDIMSSLTDAVLTLHNAGIVHRDIKPANIMMKGDIPILIDYDLSCLTVTPENIQDATKQLMLCSGSKGTPIYMDIVIHMRQMGSTYKFMSGDIYSLGVTFYNLLTRGDYPYNAETLDDFVRKLSLPPKPLHAGNITLDMLVMDMINKDPKLRPTLDVVYEILSQVIRQL